MRDSGRSVPSVAEEPAVDLRRVEDATVAAFPTYDFEIGVSLREVPEVLEADVRSHVTGTASADRGQVCRDIRLAALRCSERVRLLPSHAYARQAL